jgi:cytoskeletal protein CcmA (bactofilin family)
LQGSIDAQVLAVREGAQFNGTINAGAAGKPKVANGGTTA